MDQEAKYLIWSEEHGAWWAPESRGYTRRIREAGRYSEKRGRDIVLMANLHQGPKEVLIKDPFNAESTEEKSLKE